MKHRLLHPIFMLVALLLSGSAALRAQEPIVSPYEYIETNQTGGAFAGYMAADPGTQDFGPQPGPVFGIRYSIRFQGPLLFEPEVMYFPTTRAVYDTIQVNEQPRRVGETSMRLLMAGANLRFNITGPRTFHNLSPYILLGGGAAIDLARKGGIDEQLPSGVRYSYGTSFAGLLGTGVEWFPTSTVSVRLDARANLWQVKTPDAFLAQRPSLPGSEWTQNALFSAGFAYHF